MLPGMFLDAPEFPSEIFKSPIWSVLQSFSASPSHHFITASEIPASLITATHMFVCEDLSTPPLQPLYLGPYLVLQKDDKYFTLQLGAQEDKVSIDRLKPVISTKVIVPQVPPTRGNPRRAHSNCSLPPAAPPRIRFSSPLSRPRPLPHSLSSPPGFLRFLEETLLERPDNQLQLHLLVNLIDDAKLKTTFVDSNLASFHDILCDTVFSNSLCLYICFLNKHSLSFDPWLALRSFYYVINIINWLILYLLSFWKA